MYIQTPALLCVYIYVCVCVCACVCESECECVCVCGFCCTRPSLCVFCVQVNFIVWMDADRRDDIHYSLACMYTHILNDMNDDRHVEMDANMRDGIHYSSACMHTHILNETRNDIHL